MSISLDKTLRIWDVDIWVEIASLNGFSGKLRSLALNSDETQIVAGDELGQVVLLSLENFDI